MALHDKFVPTTGTVSGHVAQEGRKSSTDSPKTTVHYKLNAISEQRVLKQGVLKLQKGLAGKLAPEELLELPRRRDGGQLFMTPSFYQRLLGGLELKTLLEGDVSAAQSDVKHLRLEQLLTIRASTLDWATESETHSAHTCFLQSLDHHLFERLARHFVGSPASETSSKPDDAFYALGVRLALVVGAQEVMSSGPWLRDNQQERPPLPRLWAIGLNSADWPGFKAAVVHTEDFWAKLSDGDGSNFVKALAGKQVAVPIDRSTGDGKDRRLHWDINVLDPTVDDIQGEIDKTDLSRDQRIMSNELSEVLRRRTFGRREVLGLPLDATPKAQTSASDELSRALKKRLAGRAAALGLPAQPHPQAQESTAVKEEVEQLPSPTTPQTQQTTFVEQSISEQESEVEQKSQEMDASTSPRSMDHMQETPARKVDAPWDCHIDIDDGMTPPRPTKLNSARSEAAPDSARVSGIPEQCWEVGEEKMRKIFSEERRSKTIGQDATTVKDTIFSSYVPECFAGMMSCGNRCSCS